MVGGNKCTCRINLQAHCGALCGTDAGWIVSAWNRKLNSLLSLNFGNAAEVCLSNKGLDSLLEYIGRALLFCLSVNSPMLTAINQDSNVNSLLVCSGMKNPLFQVYFG